MGTEKDQRIMERLVWVEHKDGSGHLQLADYVEPVKTAPKRRRRIIAALRSFGRLLRR